MIPRIRQLLHTALFQPFSVRTSNGREYPIPTADHAAIHPNIPRLIIFLDDGGQVEFAPLHLAAVVRNGNVETA
jgi:hypothetical protein